MAAEKTSKHNQDNSRIHGEDLSQLWLSSEETISSVFVVSHNRCGWWRLGGGGGGSGGGCGRGVIRSLIMSVYLFSSFSTLQLLRRIGQHVFCAFFGATSLLNLAVFVLKEEEEEEEDQRLPPLPPPPLKKNISKDKTRGKNNQPTNNKTNKQTKTNKQKGGGGWKKKQTNKQKTTKYNSQK